MPQQTTVVTSLPPCGCLHSRPKPFARPAGSLSTSTRHPFAGHQLCHRAPKRYQHSICTAASSVTQTTSVFPAGRKQARVKLPACILKVAATDVLHEDFEEVLSSATAGGITGVLLTDTSGSDGAALYEAACKVKEQLRSRAVLLIADRTDIVDAAEADGVLLSSKGAAHPQHAKCNFDSLSQSCSTTQPLTHLERSMLLSYMHMIHMLPCGALDNVIQPGLAALLSVQLSCNVLSVTHGKLHCARPSRLFSCNAKFQSTA